MEVGSAVHEEVHYTTKRLNELANSFEQQSRKYVGMDFKDTVGYWWKEYKTE